MTAEEFQKKVSKCKYCGSVPELIAEYNSDDGTLVNFNTDGKYRVVCTECKWNGEVRGYQTRRFKTIERALKSWNKGVRA